MGKHQDRISRCFSAHSTKHHIPMVVSTFLSHRSVSTTEPLASLILKARVNRTEPVRIAEYCNSHPSNPCTPPPLPLLHHPSTPLHPHHNAYFQDHLPSSYHSYQPIKWRGGAGQGGRGCRGQDDRGGSTVVGVEEGWRARIETEANRRSAALAIPIPLSIA